MLRDIIAKEIQDTIMSPRFVFTFLLCTILILLSVYTGINNYQAEKKEYSAAVINKTYRTDDFSIIFGMSNSALFSVYALLEAPETFNYYIASSPMIGHCPDYIKDKAEVFVNKTAVQTGFCL